MANVSNLVTRVTEYYILRNRCCFSTHTREVNEKQHTYEYYSLSSYALNEKYRTFKR